MKRRSVPFRSGLFALGAAVAAGPSSTPLAAQTAPGPVGPSAIAFAAAVALGEGEIAVGRPGEAALLPMPPLETGGVHLFRRDAAGEWVETAALSAPGGKPGDGFGASVALAGDVLLVGSPGREKGRGAVFAYARAGTGWRLADTLGASDPGAEARFGSAVVALGEIALVGAPGAGEGGAAYAFRRDGSGRWSEIARIRPSAPEAGARFGAALDARGDVALVGAPGPALAASLLGGGERPKPGAAYVFRRDAAGGWSEAARLAVPDAGPLALGSAVLLHGGGALVAAPAADRGVGAVYRFAPDAAGAWVAAGRLSPDGAEPPALLGHSLAAAGEDVLAGAPMADGFAGAVHVFRSDPAGAWKEVQRLRVEGAGGLGSLLGFALAARDGVAVAGAPVAAFFEGVGHVLRRDASGRWSAGSQLAGGAGALETIAGGEVRCDAGRASAFACREVDLLSFLPVPALGGGRGVMVNDLWGWTDPETDREYAIVGRVNGTAFVDVTDPHRPVYLGDLPLTEGATPNLWRDMKVYGNHVFIVADGAGAHGVQIFDLTRLRETGRSPVTFRESAHYDGIHSAHNIAINEETGFAFVVGASGGGETCGGGLHIVDVREPQKPTFAGCFSDPTTGNAGTGYTHDAQCVVYRGPDGEHRGREICFGANETALSIADVTDKRNPVALSAAAYPNVGYAHQGWLSEDHRWFFLDDELDELSGTASRTRTLVWDVQDLDDPVLLAEHLGTTAASDHNLYVRGRFVYQSNYVSGLRILDISDPAKPVEVGFFDTVPLGEDAPGFAGSWSNYPFFRSGTIAVTSMREGLFLLRKREGKPVS